VELKLPLTMQQCRALPRQDRLATEVQYLRHQEHLLCQQELPQLKQRWLAAVVTVEQQRAAVRRVVAVVAVAWQ
jgi:hypothetical protein